MLHASAMKMQVAGVGARADDFVILHHDRARGPESAGGVLVSLILSGAHPWIVERDEGESAVGWEEGVVN